MSTSRVKDENYYLISGFMLNRLKLRGNALNVYAIIYGFSQDGENEFTGSLQYLCDFVGASKPTVIKALQELTEKELIFKREEIINNVKFNRYKVNLQAVKILNEGSKETLTGSKETLMGGSKETLHNNIYINNNNNIDIKKERKKENSSYNEIISTMIVNESVKETLNEFIKMRTLIKKPLTDYALKKLVNKLNKLSPTPSKQVEILERSIINNWQDIYELKEDKQESKSSFAEVANNIRQQSENKEYDNIDYNDLEF